nr:hypothetical protein CFP56_08097 [Quercus suber]
MAGLPAANTTLSVADRPPTSQPDDQNTFAYISPPAATRPLLAPMEGFQAINSLLEVANPSVHSARSPARTVNTSLPSAGPSSSDPPLVRKLQPTAAAMRSRIRELRPAPPRKPLSLDPVWPPPKTCFYDLPAELRIEIYRLALESVHIHILPQSSGTPACPHSLIRTSRQVRLEVLPIMHSMCEIRVNITDFNFEPLLTWLARIPPDQESNLTKNNSLSIRLCTSAKPSSVNGDSLRRWLHLRADVFRPQPRWKYSGPNPKPPTANDLKRRAKRMTEQGKKRELEAMLKAIGVLEA